MSDFFTFVFVVLALLYIGCAIGMAYERSNKT
jgi:hypothetical protein